MPMRRRPLLRTAAIAGGAAYVGRKSGQRSAETSERESEQEARIAQLEAEQRQPETAPPPQAAPPPAAAPTGDPMDDKIEQLKKLAELRDSGVLTDEEFTAEKKKLLG